MARLCFAKTPIVTGEAQKEGLLTWDEATGVLKAEQRDFLYCRSLTENVLVDFLIGFSLLLSRSMVVD